MRRAVWYFLVMTATLLGCVIDARSQSDVRWIFCGLSGATIHDIAVTDRGTVYAQSDSGLFRSTDDGDTWLRLFESGGRVVVTAASIVLAGVDSLLLKSTDEGVTWTTILDAKNWEGWGLRWVTSTSIDPLTGVILAATGSVYCMDGKCPCWSEGELLRSTDGGETWDTTDIRRYAQSVVLVGNGLAYVATTTDDGPEWVQELGCHRDTVWRTTDNGASWAWSWGGGEGVSALRAGQGKDLFFCYRDSILSSRDSGASWQTINAVPNPNDLAFNAQGDMFISTWGAVYRNFKEINDGLTDPYTTCLAVSPSGHVYVGTIGGGVFRTAETTVNVAGQIVRSPESFSLEQNYPNPFNPSTTIRYTLPEKSRVSLTLFNMLGQCLAVLVEGEVEPGSHEVEFDASGLATGVYLYQLRAGAYMETRALMVVR